jgi:geranylgeranyl pyrophosphate synthase
MSMHGLSHYAEENGSLLGGFERRMEEVIHRISHPGFQSILTNAVGGGKRVRPLLTCLSCEAVGGNPRDAIDVAVAVELLHVASLVHDDIMDGSTMRRGRPTVAEAHGIPVAVLAGDMLLATAFRLVQHSASQRSGEIGRVLTGAFVDLCEGQAYDLLPVSHERRDRERHRHTVEQKTARLLETAASLGAMCAPCEDLYVRALGAFGFHLGMAYQAQDDLLDHAGDEAETGKSLRLDVQNGRTTYLTVLYTKSDPVEALRAEVRSHTETACRALEVLPPTDARSTLQGLAFTLIERRK